MELEQKEKKIKIPEEMDNVLDPKLLIKTYVDAMTALSIAYNEFSSLAKKTEFQEQPIPKIKQETLPRELLEGDQGQLAAFISEWAQGNLTSDEIKITVSRVQESRASLAKAKASAEENFSKILGAASLLQSDDNESTLRSCVLAKMQIEFLAKYWTSLPNYQNDPKIEEANNAIEYLKQQIVDTQRRLITFEPADTARWIDYEKILKNDLTSHVSSSHISSQVSRAYSSYFHHSSPNPSPRLDEKSPKAAPLAENYLSVWEDYVNKVEKLKTAAETFLIELRTPGRRTVNLREKTTDLDLQGTMERNSKAFRALDMKASSDAKRYYELINNGFEQYRRVLSEITDYFQGQCNSSLTKMRKQQLFDFAKQLPDAGYCQSKVMGFLTSHKLPEEEQIPQEMLPPELIEGEQGLRNFISDRTTDLGGDLTESQITEQFQKLRVSLDNRRQWARDKFLLALSSIIPLLQSQNAQAHLHLEFLVQYWKSLPKDQEGEFRIRMAAKIITLLAPESAQQASASSPSASSTSSLSSNSMSSPAICNTFPLDHLSLPIAELDSPLNLALTVNVQAIEGELTNSWEKHLEAFALRSRDKSQETTRYQQQTLDILVQQIRKEIIHSINQQHTALIKKFKSDNWGKEQVPGAIAQLEQWHNFAKNLRRNPAEYQATLQRIKKALLFLDPEYEYSNLSHSKDEEKKNRVTNSLELHVQRTSVAIGRDVDIPSIWKEHLRDLEDCHEKAATFLKELETFRDPTVDLGKVTTMENRLNKDPKAFALLYSGTGADAEQYVALMCAALYKWDEKCENINNVIKKQLQALQGKIGNSQWGDECVGYIKQLERLQQFASRLGVNFRGKDVYLQQITQALVVLHSVRSRDSQQCSELDGANDQDAKKLTEREKRISVLKKQLANAQALKAATDTFFMEFNSPDKLIPTVDLSEKIRTMYRSQTESGQAPVLQSDEDNYGKQIDTALAEVRKKRSEIADRIAKQNIALKNSWENKPVSLSEVNEIKKKLQRLYNFTMEGVEESPQYQAIRQEIVQHSGELNALHGALVASTVADEDKTPLKITSAQHASASSSSASSASSRTANSSSPATWSWSPSHFHHPSPPRSDEKKQRVTNSLGLHAQPSSVAIGHDVETISIWEQHLRDIEFCHEKATIFLDELKTSRDPTVDLLNTGTIEDRVNEHKKAFDLVISGKGADAEKYNGLIRVAIFQWNETGKEIVRVIDEQLKTLWSKIGNLQGGAEVAGYIKQLERLQQFASKLGPNFSCKDRYSQTIKQTLDGLRAAKLDNFQKFLQSLSNVANDQVDKEMMERAKRISIWEKHLANAQALNAAADTFLREFKSPDTLAPTVNLQEIFGNFHSTQHEHKQALVLRELKQDSEVMAYDKQIHAALTAFEIKRSDIVTLISAQYIALTNTWEKNLESLSTLDTMKLALQRLYNFAKTTGGESAEYQDVLKKMVDQLQDLARLCAAVAIKDKDPDDNDEDNDEDNTLSGPGVS